MLCLCCKAQTNTLLHVQSTGLRYDKTRNPASFAGGKTWLYLKKITRRKFFQCILYKLKASYQRHIMRRKSRLLLLCSLCSYVRNGRIYVKTRKTNVFVKPNEQRRACSNIVMARKRTFRGTRKEQLTRSLIHLPSR